MHYVRRASISFGLLVVSFTACAFDPEVHQLYSYRGVEAYQACVKLGADFPKLREADFDALSAGTRAEDETQCFSRAKNWHFPHREGMWRGMWSLFGYVNHNQEGIFSERAGDFQGGVSPGDDAARKAFFERAGRVLHYIQDMRVPAHAIPVYHGPGVKDGFDGYVFNDRDNVQQMTLARCNEIAAQVKVPCTGCLEERLSRAVRETEGALRPSAAELADNPVARCWREVLWCDPREPGASCPEGAYPGFGTYVQGENRVNFGETRTARCQGESVRFDDNAYRRFFAAGYRSMLDDIVYMLVYAGRLLESAGQAGTSR